MFLNQISLKLVDTSTLSIGTKPTIKEQCHRKISRNGTKIIANSVNTWVKFVCTERSRGYEI